MNEIEMEGAADNATAAYNITVTKITKEALLLCLKEAEEQSREVDPWIDYRKAKKRSHDVPPNTFYQVQQILETVFNAMIEQLSGNKSEDIPGTLKDGDDVTNTPVRGEDIPVGKKDITSSPEGGNNPAATP